MTPLIILVEDEQAIADSVIYALRSAGYDVRWHGLARDAERSLAAETPALVILDVGLPDGDGLEMLKSLRRRSDVPVIMLTARTEEIDRVLGLELGADDYVSKPFSPRELAARVKNILKRGGRPKAGTPEADAWFEVDEARASIRLQGRELVLTRYEYLILKTLVAEPERVFSREQLMQRVWPDPAASFDRAVDAHIKALRAKLREAAPDHEVIRTHRGLGYSVRRAPG